MKKDNSKNIIIVSGNDISNLNLKDRLSESFPNYKINEIKSSKLTLNKLFKQKESNLYNYNYDYYSFFQSKLNKW